MSKTTDMDNSTRGRHTGKRGKRKGKRSSKMADNKRDDRKKRLEDMIAGRRIEGYVDYERPVKGAGKEYVNTINFPGGGGPKYGSSGAAPRAGFSGTPRNWENWQARRDARRAQWAENHPGWTPPWPKRPKRRGDGK